MREGQIKIGGKKEERGHEKNVYNRERREFAYEHLCEREEERERGGK
jgi:hypothetical protein